MSISAKLSGLFAAFLMSFSGYAFADSPDNLDIFWVRPMGEKTPLYDAPRNDAKVIQNFHMDKTSFYVTGTKKINGEFWYEVSYPINGWLKSGDAWFSPAKDQRPENLALEARMAMRLAIDLGNYPQKSESLLGKPRTAKFKAGDGVTVQTLTWSGLIIIYENSYVKAENAWIWRAAAGKGCKVSFAGIRIGDSAEKLKKFDVAFEPAKDDGLRLDDGPYHFFFAVKDGKVVAISYCFGPDVEFLKPATPDGLHELTAER